MGFNRYCVEGWGFCISWMVVRVAALLEQVWLAAFRHPSKVSRCWVRQLEWLGGVFLGKLLAFSVDTWFSVIGLLLNNQAPLRLVLFGQSCLKSGHMRVNPRNC